MWLAQKFDIKLTYLPYISKFHLEFTFHFEEFIRF